MIRAETLEALFTSFRKTLKPPSSSCGTKPHTLILRLPEIGLSGLKYHCISLLLNVHYHLCLVTSLGGGGGGTRPTPQGTGTLGLLGPGEGLSWDWNAEDGRGDLVASGLSKLQIRQRPAEAEDPVINTSPAGRHWEE